jgi:hypothetical protein
MYDLSRYLIFSTFGPDDAKGMMGLVTHPHFALEVEELPGPPFEIPDQPCSFLYRNRRI